MSIYVIVGEILSVFKQLMIAYIISECTIKRNLLRLILFLIGFILLSFILVNSVNYTQYLMIAIFLEFIIFMQTIKIQVTKGLVIFGLTLFIDSFFEGLIEMIQLIIINVSNEASSIFSFSNKLISFIFISVILIIVFTLKKKKQNYRIDHTFLYLFLSVGFFTGLVILLFVNFYGYNLTSYMNLLLLITAFIVVVSNLIITFFYWKKEIENVYFKDEISIKENILTLQEQYFNEMVDRYSDLRRFRHDIKSYILSIEHLIKNKDYEELTLLTTELKDIINNSHMITCNNVYIGAITNHFYHQCIKDLIKFEFDYSIINNIIIKPDHLCSLYYNIMNNAYEAANISINRILSIKIRSKDRALIIKVGNSVADTFDIGNIKHNHTTKGDSINHGYGLMNIKRIIDIYGGEYSFEFNDGILYSSIILLGVIENYV